MKQNWIALIFLCLEIIKQTVESLNLPLCWKTELGWALLNLEIPTPKKVKYRVNFFEYSVFSPWFVTVISYLTHENICLWSLIKLTKPKTTQGYISWSISWSISWIRWRQRRKKSEQVLKTVKMKLFFSGYRYPWRAQFSKYFNMF